MAELSLKQKTKRGLYWKFAEQFSNYGIQFVIGIVMARLLSPSDYGITALPTVFMGDRKLAEKSIERIKSLTGGKIICPGWGNGISIKRCQKKV